MKTNDKPASPPQIRPATQAGRFYEGDPQTLSQEVDGYLMRHAKDSAYENVAALIVPHAGHYYSGNVAAAAYMALHPDKQYKRIFLIGPSHYEWLNGASVNSEVDGYATPLGTVPVDRETAMQLMAADSVFSYYEKAHDREHCLEVQLPFLQRRFHHQGKGLPPIAPIIISTNDYSKLKRMAEVLKPYFNDENLFIISSDFSHYPSYEDAYKVDGKTKEAILTGSVEQFITTIEENSQSGIRNLSTSACGEFPIITLMLMMNKGYEIKHLLYQNSGDIDSSNRRRVVGYHAFAILRTQHPSPNTQQRLRVGASAGIPSPDFALSDTDKQLLKDIARKSIATAFDRQSFSSAALCQDRPALNEKCGAFVTLTQQGRLRGCIGLLTGELPLHETIYRMARAAAFEDPRFQKLRREELDKTDIEISVITPMKRIHSADEFELHRHGIFIKKGHRSGTFLPQVADEVNWTKEEFLGHCSRDKAGLGWDGWRDAELYTYEAIVF